MPKRAALRLFTPELSNSFPPSILADSSTYKYRASELSHSFGSSPPNFPAFGFLDCSSHDFETALPSFRRGSPHTAESLPSGGSSILQSPTNLPPTFQIYAMSHPPTIDQLRLEVSTEHLLGLEQHANIHRCLLAPLKIAPFSTTPRANGLCGLDSPGGLC